MIIQVQINDSKGALISNVFEGEAGGWLTSNPIRLTDGRLLYGYKIELIIKDPSE